MWGQTAVAVLWTMAVSSMSAASATLMELLGKGGGMMCELVWVGRWGGVVCILGREIERR